ncbi:anthranilate synthase component I family protein, partial [Anabaena aphanizomenioides LEGE 00250]|nr:anthranilate synthase component I family protein [Sphaerospermopsis aphanizomenoides LEGE 00250]
SARANRPDAVGVLNSKTSLSNYEATVAKIVTRVHAGDLYQANISRRYAGALAVGDHPYALFARLVAQSPAPLAAYMRLADHALVSNSPERFLSVSRRDDGRLYAFSQPIKGTRPRGANAEEDEANARALLASAKDRAENLMIVDLMRNDLSKTCVPGSVRVPRLCGLESYANVHHLVSDVEGRLRDDADAFDLFAGAFPPGSITGAPKVKAMELIGALEGSGRGPYCGSLVWLGFDGAMDSSVLIRTATCTQHEDAWQVAFNVGAGIVADSDPAEEARETVTKAASLKRAVTGHVGDEA